jgi:uncharacterized phage infection (PIP) family protein YhgE
MTATGRNESQKDISYISNLLEMLVGVYKDKPDSPLMLNMKQLHDELINKCKQQQSKLRQTISSLKKKNEDAETQGKRIEPESEHIKRMKILQAELEALNESIFNLEQQCDQLYHLMEQEQIKNNDYQNKLSKLEKGYNDDMRWRRDLIRMYKYICPVEWDLVNTNGAKGFFKPETSGEGILMFDLTGFTERQTANRLWDKLYQQFGQ